MATIVESRREGGRSLRGRAASREAIWWLQAAACWASFLLGWILLGIVLLGSGPSADAAPVPVKVAALLVVTAGLIWLTGRFTALW
jgi:hypothetical protein